ncbi:UNVERIFIED_CONTAM: hypothetical protein HHA_313540 [Hammondia hammondi]|eukprot:XP_008883565.1 hypothetical protein HHA_313540 [Hammondia hammondi]
MESSLSGLRGCLVCLVCLLVFAGLSARVAALRAPSASPLATIPGPSHLPGVHTPAPPRSHIGASHPTPLPSPSGANASLSHHGGSATKSGPASSLRDVASSSRSGVDTSEAAGTFEAAPEGSGSSGVLTPQMSSPIQHHGVRPGPSTLSFAFSPLFEGEAQREVASSFSTFLPTPSGNAWLPAQGLFQAFSDPDNGWGVRLSFPAAPCSFPASAFFSLHAAVHADADRPLLGQGEKVLDNEAKSPRGDTSASAETAGVQSATYIGGADGDRQDERQGMGSGQRKTHASHAHENVSANLCASPAIARGALERSVSSGRETSGIRGDIEAPLYSVSFSAPTDELWGENVAVCMHWSEPSTSRPSSPSSSSLSAHVGRAETLQPTESRLEAPRRDVGVGVEGPLGTSAKHSFALAFGRVPDACLWGRTAASRGGDSRDKCAKPRVEVAVEGGRRSDQHAERPSGAGVVFAETDEARETTGKASEQASSLSLPVLHAAPRMVSLNGVYDVQLALPLRLSPPAGASRPHGDVSGAGVTGQVDAKGEICEGPFRKDRGSYDDGGDGQGWRTATGRRKHTSREVGERRTGAGVLAGARCTDSGAEGGRGRWGGRDTERGEMDVQMRDTHTSLSREPGSLQAMSSERRNLSCRRRWFTKADIKEAVKWALVVMKTNLSGGCEGPYSSQALALTSLRASVPLVASRLQSAVGGGNTEREQMGQHDSGLIDGDRSGERESLGEAREFNRQGPAREDTFVDVSVPLELSIRGEDLPVDLALCLYTSRLDTDPLPLGLVRLGTPPPLSDPVLAGSGLSRHPAETRASFSGAARSESQRFGQNTIRGRDTRAARETLEPQAPVAAIAGASIPAKVLNWLAAQLNCLTFLRRSSEATSELEETLRPAGVDESESWWERAFSFAASSWGGAEAAAEGSRDSFSADAEERETEAEEDVSGSSHADASWVVYAPFAVLVGAAAGYILTLHWQARAKMQEARAKTCTGPCCSDAPSDWLAIRSSLRATHALSAAHLAPFSSSVGDARASEGGSRRANRRPKASPASSSLSSSPSADASGVSAAAPQTRKPLASSRRSRRPIAAPAERLTPSRRIYETLWGEEEILGDRRFNGDARGLGASPWQWPEEGNTRSGRRKHERRTNEIDAARWPISY